jgi:hypothetical protein
VLDDGTRVDLSALDVETKPGYLVPILGARSLSGLSKEVSCGVGGRSPRTRLKRRAKRSSQAWSIVRRKRSMKISIPTSYLRISTFPK